jgi:hypothetical protein
VPDVASISAAAGVPLVSAVAFILAVSCVSAVAVAVDGVFAVVSFPADPYVILSGIFTYCTIQ